MKYHINPGTGRVGQCRAKSAERCQFSKQLGTVVKHYDSAEEAQAEYEKMNQGKTNASIKKPKTPKQQKEQMAQRKTDYLKAMSNIQKQLTENERNSRKTLKDYTEMQRLQAEYGLNNDLSDFQKKLDNYTSERNGLLKTKKQLGKDYSDVVVVLDAEKAARAAQRKAEQEAQRRRNADLGCGGSVSFSC